VIICKYHWPKLTVWEYGGNKVNLEVPVIHLLLNLLPDHFLEINNYYQITQC